MYVADRPNRYADEYLRDDFVSPLVEPIVKQPKANTSGRRDRLLLISAFATALLTLLDAVGESLGIDRLPKSNISKTRNHSLFRQGRMLYDVIPNMPEHRLASLMQKFSQAVSNVSMFVSQLALAQCGDK
jgi:hypothetical protein